jgi:hypothetical protein
LENNVGVRAIVAPFKEDSAMQKGTVEVMEAVLRSDATVGREDRETMVELLRNCGAGSGPTLDRIVRRAEAAHLLGRGVKGLDRLVARGALKRVVFPGYRKAAGYRASDVAALIAGGRREPQDLDATSGG